MRVILHTQCGCVREIALDELTPYYVVPKYNWSRFQDPLARQSRSDTSAIRQRERRFEFHSTDRGTFGAAHYVEID